MDSMAGRHVALAHYALSIGRSRTCTDVGWGTSGRNYATRMMSGLGEAKKKTFEILVNASFFFVFFFIIFIYYLFSSFLKFNVRVLSCSNTKLLYKQNSSEEADRGLTKYHSHCGRQTKTKIYSFIL